jgi:hypothetical protein
VPLELKSLYQCYSQVYERYNNKIAMERLAPKDEKFSWRSGTATMQRTISCLPGSLRRTLETPQRKQKAVIPDSKDQTRPRTESLPRGVTHLQNDATVSRKLTHEDTSCASHSLLLLGCLKGGNRSRYSALLVGSNTCITC